MSDARRAAVHFHELLARDPGNEQARAGLASALFAYAHELRAAGSIEAAAAAFAKAAKFAPDNADAWLALGNACMEAELHRVDLRQATASGEDWLAHAVDAFARAAALRPGDTGTAARRAMAARYACAFRDADAAIATLRASANPVCEPMAAVALLDDAALQRDAIAAWSRAKSSDADAISARGSARGSASVIGPPRTVPPRGRAISIGRSPHPNT